MTHELQATPELFEKADSDPDRPLPTVRVVPYEGPEVRNLGLTNGYAIEDEKETRVGTFTLVGKTGGEKRWINNVRIDNPEHKGERYAVSAYVHVLGSVAIEGSKLISDPSGLSESSQRVWDSLVSRGLAEPTEEHDQHGIPRYESHLPED